MTWKNREIKQKRMASQVIAIVCTARVWLAPRQHASESSDEFHRISLAIALINFFSMPSAHRVFAACGVATSAL